MQLVQEGRVRLDDPVSKYGVTLESEGVIRVRHLLSHTSEGNPGEQYRYNGNRFAELDKVIQKATGKGFAELLIANILDPLGMNETAPNVPPMVKTTSPAGADPNASPLKTEAITEKHQQRFDAVLRNLAGPYALDDKRNISKSKYPTHFSASAGLISSVLDMAKYDIAIDQHRFLSKETQQLAFTPAVSTKGGKLPYGLGWFTQDYKGERLIWHYGYWTCNSSLILKVPGRNLTFIAMANTDNLSRPTDLGAGDVTSSPVGLAFLKTFIFPEIFGEELPEINWQLPDTQLQEQLKSIAGKAYADVYNKELLVQARMYASVGKGGESTRLFRAHSALYSKSLPDDLAKKPVIAQIVRVTDNADQTIEFSLPRAQGVRVFAVGEGQADRMFDYGWIESAETGKTVWEMKGQETKRAGGAEKNRLIDDVITLPAGRYRLRYKSDDSHSFELWNSPPPEINFWGIALYAVGERP